MVRHGKYHSTRVAGRDDVGFVTTEKSGGRNEKNPTSMVTCRALKEEEQTVSELVENFCHGSQTESTKQTFSLRTGRSHDVTLTRNGLGWSHCCVVTVVAVLAG